jgi:hypothetical protein
VHLEGVFEETSDVLGKYCAKESKLWKQLYHGGVVTRTVVQSDLLNPEVSEKKYFEIKYIL